MRKIKLLFVFGIFVGLFGIVLGMQNAKFVNVEKRDVYVDSNSDKYGSAYLNIRFYKYDQNKNFLAGTKFKLSSYNNIYKLYPSEDYYDDEVMIDGERFYSSSREFDNAYSVLSDKQKALVSSVSTTDDFNKFSDGEYVFCGYYSAQVKRENIDYRETYDYYCSVPLPTVFYLEEVKVPNGYAKSKVLVPGIIRVTYGIKDYEGIAQKKDVNFRVSDYFDETYDVELVGIDLRNYNSYIEYGDVDENVLLGTDFDEAYDLMYEYAQGTECYKKLTNLTKEYEVASRGLIMDYRTPNYCYFSLFNEKGSI